MPNTEDLARDVRIALNALEAELSDNQDGLAKIASMRTLLNSISIKKSAKTKKRVKRPVTVDRPASVTLPENPTAADYAEQIEMTKKGIEHWDNLLAGGLNSPNTRFARVQKGKLERWLAKVTELAGDNTPWADVSDN